MVKLIHKHFLYAVLLFFAPSFNVSAAPPALSDGFPDKPPTARLNATLGGQLLNLAQTTSHDTQLFGKHLFNRTIGEQLRDSDGLFDSSLYKTVIGGPVADFLFTCPAYQDYCKNWNTVCKENITPTALNETTLWERANNPLHHTRHVIHKGYLFFDPKVVVSANSYYLKDYDSRITDSSWRLDIQGDTHDHHAVRLQLQIGTGNSDAHALASILVPKGHYYSPLHIFMCLLESHLTFMSDGKAQTVTVQRETKNQKRRKRFYYNDVPEGREKTEKRHRLPREVRQASINRNKEQLEQIVQAAGYYPVDQVYAQFNGG